MAFPLTAASLVTVMELDPPIYSATHQDNVQYDSHLFALCISYFLGGNLYLYFLFQCHDNVEGRRCDRCKENKYDRQHGCRNCPDCYNLVEDAVKAHRNKLNDLQRILKDIANSPTTTDDVDFESRLAEVQRAVNKLHDDAKNGAGSMLFFYKLSFPVSSLVF